MRHSSLSRHFTAIQQQDVQEIDTTLHCRTIRIIGRVFQMGSIWTKKRERRLNLKT